MAKAASSKLKKTAMKSRSSPQARAKAAPPASARQALKKSAVKPAAKAPVAKAAKKPASQKSSATEAVKANKWVYTFGDGKAEGKAGLRDLLGGKGANLAEMANLGLRCLA
jgi:pyruvate, orthophosphate dikinase